ncbi:UDP-2,4-diacetamido-2,4,6-trideoxy-beta-L-altropyranose hydrolase [Arcobacteraceae bacterium]|nr:UDP-2,4-diacetamido-2,4,6-trideoxy-beta-L-altropyranose hydrolase [Arcobacteraceae bacterium]
MKNKNILFRADSSSLIGTGHIKRDLVLAEKFKKKNNCIFFACQDLNHNINHEIVKKHHTLEVLSSNSLEELNLIIKKHQIDMIVIDHYKIDATFEKQIKCINPSLKIMVIDDTYQKHYCDILLNHNIYAKRKNYKKLVPKKCKLLCGIKYTLLREEFRQEMNKIKEKKKNYKKENSIFLAMGGADTSNLNLSILKILKKFKDIKINIVTTTANNNLDQLQSYCKKKKQIKLHINSNKIAHIIGQSKFGIITPSVTANECYFMKIPFISIKTASNQKYMYNYLKKKKFLVMKKYSSSKLKKYLTVLLNG